MNAPITFNTLAFVRRMEASGMDSAQAEALADAPREVVFETTATSAEVRESETCISIDIGDVRRDVGELEVRLRGELRELELRLRHDLTVRMGVMAGAIIAVLGTLITLN